MLDKLFVVATFMAAAKIIVFSKSASFTSPASKFQELDNFLKKRSVENCMAMTAPTYNGLQSCIESGKISQEKRDMSDIWMDFKKRSMVRADSQHRVGQTGEEKIFKTLWDDFEKRSGFNPSTKFGNVWSDFKKRNKDVKEMSDVDLDDIESFMDNPGLVKKSDHFKPEPGSNSLMAFIGGGPRISKRSWMYKL